MEDDSMHHHTRR